MSRIRTRFETLARSGRKALIEFITAGDPTPEATVALMHALVASGADILELGVPFSDPMADGPVIQRSSERALAHGTTLRRVIDMVREFRVSDAETPVVLMGYLNPIEAIGYQQFAALAGAAGVDGVLTVDLPPEEADSLVAMLAGNGLDPIFLVAPTTSNERLARIGASARGFLYYVTLKGVTGSDKLDVAAVRARVAELRRHTALPIAVGFGIKDAVSARAAADCAEGVVVGSALVARVEAAGADVARVSHELAAFTASLRRALDTPVPGASVEAAAPS